MQEKPWIILGLLGASLALTATALVTVVIPHWLSWPLPTGPLPAYTFITSVSTLTQ